MRELLAQDGQGDAHPGQDGGGHGGPDGEAVYEVVNSIPEYDHPGHSRYLPLSRFVCLLLARVVVVVQLTVRGDDDGLHTVAVAVLHHHLLRPPGPDVHRDLEEPLDHEEEVDPAEDSEGDVEVVVVGEHLGTATSVQLLAGIAQSSRT